MEDATGAIDTGREQRMRMLWDATAYATASRESYPMKTRIIRGEVRAAGSRVNPLNYSFPGAEMRVTPEFEPTYRSGAGRKE